MSKFKIPIIPPTTQKSVKFPNNLLAEVEDIIRGKETTFSAFVIAATRHAVNELKENDTKN